MEASACAEGRAPFWTLRGASPKSTECRGVEVPNFCKQYFIKIDEYIKTFKKYSSQLYSKTMYFVVDRRQGEDSVF